MSLKQIGSSYGSASAAGHQAIMNEFNEGQRTKYLDRTIWKHRCESMIGRVSDRTWFDQVDDLNCQDELVYKLQPTGIKISAMRSYNQELKSHAPTQTTKRMNFGEWTYSQWKFSKMEMNEKCDVDSYMDDLEEAYRREMNDYMDKIALLRMSCVSSCWSGECANVGIPKSSPTNPIRIDKTNSHQLFTRSDQMKKGICDDRGFFMTWPRCEMDVLSENETLAKKFEGCCNGDSPDLTGRMPTFGTRTTLEPSDHVPFTECADGSRVYAVTHAPYGSFGYAAIMAESETVDSNSIEDHWSRIHRMISRFGMVIPVPWDYTTHYIRIKRDVMPLETCA